MIALLLGAVGFSVAAQTKKQTLQERVAALEDKAALKELVDTFSNLSDMKDAKAQGLLFTEDATVKTIFKGQVLADLKGRKEIVERFDQFLKMQEIVYHQNGQQTVTLQGNQAEGISYCFVSLVSEREGKKYLTLQGVRYRDEYVKQGGKWYIKHRVSEFLWRDTKEYSGQ